jgi:hypothetical protein
MLPTHELDTFLMTVEEAGDLAVTGQATSDTKPSSPGFIAREVEDKLWAAELVVRYQDALKRFVALYSVGRA